MRVRVRRLPIPTLFAGIMILATAGCPTKRESSRPVAQTSQPEPAQESEPAPQPIIVEMPVPADATEEPVVAIWVNHRYAMIRNQNFDTRTPRAIILAWKDGRMIWSGDPVNGGPPYRRGLTDAAGVERLLAKLAEEKVFNGGGFKWSSWGPDASFTVVAIADGSRRLYMESWHELMERRPNLVVTAAGVTVLNDRTRDEVLANEPEDYRRARRIWTQIRHGLNALIPGPGEPSGEIELELWKVGAAGTK